MSNGEVNCACITQVSTIFVFETVQFQRAANSVYEYKAAFDAAPSNAAKGIKYQFKTDFERMQYIIGRQGRVCRPPTVGS
jgi:hypothetical protein